MLATSRCMPAKCCSIDDTRWRRSPRSLSNLVNLGANSPQLVEHQVLDVGVHPVRVAEIRAGTKRSSSAPDPGKSGRRSPGAAASPHLSSATVLRSVPMPVTSTSTTSPGFSHFGGSKRAPAPIGVPVEITSPGLSAAQVET